MNRLGLRLALWALAAFSAVGACSTGNPALIGDQDGSPTYTDGAPNCNTPEVGCPCATPGAQAACGQVVRKSGDYVTCSEGEMTCTAGTWGSCIGDQIYMKSLGSTTLKTQGLQTTPSPCTGDPCDPACTNYTDNGSGLDAGTGLQPTDAGGITLSQVDGAGCQGLQCQQVTCAGDGGVTTTISGTVVAGTLPTYGTADPLPNVLVYVPNAPLNAFAAGVQCDATCSAEVSGAPIAATLTNFDGTFTLTNVPVGQQHPRRHSARAVAPRGSVQRLELVYEYRRRQHSHAAHANGLDAPVCREHPLHRDLHGRRRRARVRPPQKWASTRACSPTPAAADVSRCITATALT